MKKLTMFTILMALTTTSFAAPAWYYGKITRVWHYSAAGFVVTLSGNALDDCKHKYAYFTKGALELDHKNAVYSMALSAFHTGQPIGIVIDKQAAGDGMCFGTSMDMTK